MAEKLNSLLNICDKEGKAITVLDGKLTLSQLIMLVVGVIILGIVLSCIKGVVKVAISIGVVCLCLVNLGVMSPKQLEDIAGQIKEKGIESYSKIASTSESIKIEDGTIKLKLEEDWVDVKDIDSYVDSRKDTITVKVGKKSYSVKDSVIVGLIKTFK